MLTDQELRAKIKRYEKRWIKSFHEPTTLQKERKDIRLTKKINKLDTQLLNRYGYDLIEKES